MSLVELRFRKYHRAERLTRSGLLFFLAIIGIGAVAINSGNNLLYLVFSALLSALIFSGLLSVANLRRLDVSLDAVDDVYAGCPALLAVTVRNTGSFPLFFARVSVQAGGEAVSLSIPFAGAHSAVELPLTLTLPARGRVTRLRADIASTFPFGIVEMRRDVPVGGELVVYPLVRPAILQQRDEQGEHRLERARAGGDGDFFSLRRYHAGDDSRHIDWKVSARRGDPYVVEREARYQQETVFYLDTARSAWSDSQAFELGVSKIASGLTSALESGETIALALAGSFLDGRDRRAWQQAMELLAMVKLTEDAPRPGPLHSFTHEDISFVDGAL
ncbi:MAG: DUF58 domain-containing protein [Candidatus Cryosericum sp.]